MDFGTFVASMYCDEDRFWTLVLCCRRCHIAYMGETRYKASANKENRLIATWIFSPQILFLLILYIGNKASLAIRHEIDWSLEMRYCGVPLYKSMGL